jgi:hypothetical protein
MNTTANYELWDGLSGNLLGNLLGVFESEGEALSFIRRYGSSEQGEPEEELGLLCRSSTGEAELIAGGELLRMARSAAAA